MRYFWNRSPLTSGSSPHRVGRDLRSSRSTSGWHSMPLERSPEADLGAAGAEASAAPRVAGVPGVGGEHEQSARAASAASSGGGMQVAAIESATHSGRRTVITALSADGGLDITDVARHVGHSNPATTAGYVKSLGERPAATARRAAGLLDPTVVAEGAFDLLDDRSRGAAQAAAAPGPRPVRCQAIGASRSDGS